MGPAQILGMYVISSGKEGRLLDAETIGALFNGIVQFFILRGKIQSFISIFLMEGYNMSRPVDPQGGEIGCFLILVYRFSNPSF